MTGERDHATHPRACNHAQGVAYHAQRLGIPAVIISHQRAFTNLPVQTVEVEFVPQTRSHDHVRQVIEALARKGFDATLHLE